MNAERGASHNGTEIAIIGMAGRFPGALDVDEQWRNLRDGVESMRRLTDEELDELGVDPALVAAPNFVPVAAYLDAPDCFDADFFGMQPREAAYLDPQHRVFLECAWHALENAGYDPSGCPGAVGVYAGATMNTYLLFNLAPHLDGGGSALRSLQVGSLSAGDFLATRVAYKLNLTGPAQTVLTACSTSLVAVHEASQALLLGECDMALAGGVSVQVNNRGGYLYTPQGMVSPDGHCRVFDAAADGTVFGSGAGIVVLKRLADALDDGDRIRAVVLGSAVNNDGNRKVGYTAPSVDGQAKVIAQALATANVTADSIGYVEAHGAGTRLGDPIEIRALTKAYRAQTDRRGYCAIGSVKSNVGHLDVAAGVTGLIKTVLSLEHEEIPPTLHFERANPEIDFDSSPFFVNTDLRAWKSNGLPRRAGVSSFGVGGTNAHVVVEESAPAPPPAPADRAWQVLLVSARTETALERAGDELRRHLGGDAALDLADAAYTSQLGRHAFAHRRYAVGRDAAEAAEALADGDPQRTGTGTAPNEDPGVVFMFTGMGPQHAGMAAGLYREEPVFAEHVARCAELLRPTLGADLVEELYGSGPAGWMDRPHLSLPAMFAVEYALARLWMSWGVQPKAVIGHSTGEYVAACVAGVFGLPDALSIVALRGRLFEEIPDGKMLTVSLPEDDVVPLLGDRMSLAAVNAPGSCAVSGPADAVGELAAHLESIGVSYRNLPFPAAAHSALVEPVLERFGQAVGEVRCTPPELPLISNLTGAWAGEEVAAAGYWVRHLRETVRFADGVRTVTEAGRVLLEVGPGQTLTRMARLSTTGTDATVVSSMRHPKDERDDGACLAAALGQVWAAGGTVDWRALHTSARRRVTLPGYPFERQRHWVYPAAGGGKNDVAADADATEPRTGTGSVEPASSPNGTGTAGRPNWSTPDVQEVRRAVVVEKVSEILSRLSGLRADSLDPDANFFQLGFDSLALAEAGLAMSEFFGVEIAVRELFEETPTIDALVGHIVANLPADALADEIAERLPPGGGDETRTAPYAPAGVPELPEAVGGDVGRVISQQLELVRRQMEMQQSLFTQQLETLRGGPAGPAWDGATGAAPPNGATAATAAPSGSASPARPTGRASVVPLRALKADHEPLTDRQRRHVEEFAARYSRRTRTSKELTGRSRLVRANFRNVENFHPDFKELLYPIFAEHGAGGRIRDVDGNEYVDLTMGFGAGLLGHTPPFIAEAVQTELTHGQGLLLGPCSSHAEDVARLIAELTGVERVGFFTSGTHAVMVAIRLARAAVGRNKLAIFSGAFHGTYDATLVRRDLLGSGEGGLPVSPGITEGAVRDVLVFDYCKSTSLQAIRERAGELAAVLVEPVQSRAPGLEVGEFLRELREITEEAGIALIFDEMITGFRLHPGGAQARFGVRADLVTYGKILGGGMPIGVVAGRAEFMDGIDGGMWRYGDDSAPPNEERHTVTGGTFCEHPLAMVAARAALEHFAEEGPDLQRRLDERTAEFVRRLRHIFESEDVPIEVTYFSSIVRFTVPADLELFYYHLIDKGVYMWEGRTLFLSVAHTDHDLDHVVEAVRESLAELRRGGFLPEPPLDPGALPLTEEQRQLWIVAAADAEGTQAFNDAATVHLTGELDVPALLGAVTDLPSRHEALRTAFQPDGETQAVLRSVEAEVPVLDWSGLTADESAVRLESWLADEVRRPFDLAAAPLMRVTLIRHGERDHRLIVVGHHIVLDGWSWSVFLQDLVALYAARRGGPEPAEAAQFRDYLVWRAKLMEGPEADAALAYWRRELAEAPPPLELPESKLSPARRTHTGRRRQEKVDAELYRRLTAVAREHSCTLPMVLFGAYQVLLHRLSGRDDFVVSMPAAGQLAMGRPTLVGNCNNLIPVRARIDASARFSDHLREVKRALGRAYEHRAVSVAELAARGPDGLRIPGSTVMFNVDRAVSVPASEDLAVTVSAGPVLYARADLSLNAVDVGGELRLDFDYSADAFAPGVCESWFAAFVRLLRAVVESPDAVIADLPPSEPQVPYAMTDPGRADPDDVVAGLLSKLRETDGTVDGPAFPVDLPSARVLDDGGRPQPPGVPGQLCLVRDGEAHRTVLAAWTLPDGRVGVLGPAERRTLVDDRTVWLPALEAALRAVPGVAGAAVLPAEDGTRLLAFLEPADGRAGEELAEHCRAVLPARLPVHYQPASYAVMPELPRLASGEVDLQALDPDIPPVVGAAVQVAPRDEVEERVAALWAEVLEVPSVGVTDGFFDLGGTSLQATRLLSRLRRDLGVTLPLRTLFDEPTVERLAKAVRGGEPPESATRVPELVRVSRTGNVFPLSYSQRRLWYLEQLGADASYVVFLAVRLRGSLDIGALRAGLNEVLRRHEVLRTRFYEVDGDPVQEIGPPVDVALPELDLSGLGPADQEERVRQLAREEAERPFDLDRSPLMRARLLALAADHHVLLLSMHHIVSDGWSFEVLLTDLGTAYHAYVAGEPVELPDLSVQYVDYAEWQRRWMDGEAHRAQLDHWRAVLGSTPPVFELPTDRPRPSVQTFNGAVHRCEIPSDVVLALRELSREENVNLFIPLLAAFQALLRVQSGQDDVIVGTPSANRHRLEVEQLIGFFVNMLVIRTAFSGRLTFRELIRQVRDEVLAADANQDLPFEVLVDELLAERDPSRPPLFTVMFLMDTVPKQWVVAGLELTRVPTDWSTAKFDLSLLAEDVGQECRLVFEYNTDLFEPQTVELLARRFTTFLRNVAADPEARL